MSIQLLLKKLQDLEPWEEWQQASFCPRAIQSRHAVIVYTLGAWCYNSDRGQHVFDSLEDVYSFVEGASVLGQFKAL